MNQPILFLDMDGVMAPFRLDLCRGIKIGALDPVAVGIIKNVVDKTHCQIVIHSDWKHINQQILFNKLKDNQFDQAWLHEDWKTSNLEQSSAECAIEEYACQQRISEIKEWLTRHPEVTRYAIIDDLPLETINFVKTDGWNGVLYEHYNALLELLQNLV